MYICGTVSFNQFELNACKPAQLKPGKDIKSITSISILPAKITKLMINRLHR